MKELKLNYSITSEVVEDQGQPLKIPVNDIILPSITRVPQGVNFDGMAERIDLIRKVKAGIASKSPSILLENVEHAALVKAMKAREDFLVVDPAIYDFINQVAGTPEAEVATKDTKIKEHPLKKAS